MKSISQRRSSASLAMVRIVPGSISESVSQKSVVPDSESQTASVCRDVSGRLVVAFGLATIESAASSTGGDEPISDDYNAVVSSSGNSRSAVSAKALWR
jgi:hypothetical protein